MTTETTNLGRITISPEAIATIAANTASQTYGVVGMASKNIVEGIANVLTQDPHHGVDVNADEASITIDMYVVVEYGTRISSVATSVANAVRYKVEQSLGMPVRAVNVHVQGLRVTHTD
ncbi:MAG: Asp23/Gls24 family envelope stress response protein [Anaerolineales bacterium]|nr:MAG: Asp23/Gls24 family envelope stress response protein [Anaerolineales bacterium]